MRNPIHIVGPIALLVILPCLGACSSSSSFWDRSPCVAGARQVAPNCGAPQYAPPSCDCPPPTTQCPPQYRAPVTQCPPPQCPPQYSPPTTQCPPACPPQYQAQRQPQYQAPTSKTPVQSPASVQEMAVLDRVNRIRAQHSLRPLRFQQHLWVAARAHSEEQRRHGYMGHGSPDPGRRSLAQRMGQAGYKGSVFAEVVAWGYSDTAAVVEGWMNSPDHRRILLDPELSEGAFSRVGEYWTGNLGAPARFRQAPAPAPKSDYTFRRAPAPTASPRYTPQPTPRYTAPKPAPRRTYVAPAPRSSQPAPRKAPPSLPIRSSGFG